jgi:hypothetical protein
MRSDSLCQPDAGCCGSLVPHLVMGRVHAGMCASFDFSAP